MQIPSWNLTSSSSLAARGAPRRCPCPLALHDPSLCFSKTTRYLLFSTFWFSDPRTPLWRRLRRRRDPLRHRPFSQRSRRQSCEVSAAYPLYAARIASLPLRAASSRPSSAPHRRSKRRLACPGPWSVHSRARPPRCRESSFRRLREFRAEMSALSYTPSGSTIHKCCLTIQAFLVSTGESQYNSGEEFDVPESFSFFSAQPSSRSADFQPSKCPRYRADGLDRADRRLNRHYRPISARFAVEARSVN